MKAAPQTINLADIIEIKQGFETIELFSLIISSCDCLLEQRAYETSSKQSASLFIPTTVDITADGLIRISRVTIDVVPTDFLPPEISKNPFFDDLSDSQDVWVLGKILIKAGLSNQTDVSLLSLLNLMTVEDHNSRPTLEKLALIAKNKVPFDSARTILQRLYKELMGDLDDLINDPFHDEIRFSSTRSSLSLTYGSSRKLKRIFRPNDLSQHRESSIEVYPNIINNGFKHSDSGDKEDKSSKFLPPSNASLEDESTADSSTVDIVDVPPQRHYIKNMNKQAKNKMEHSAKTNLIQHFSSNEEYLHDDSEDGQFNDPPEALRLHKDIVKQFISADDREQQFTNTQFVRQNSLQQCNIHGKASSLRPITKHNVGVVVPEFVTNASQPSVRLRAQSFRKKGVSLMRSDTVPILVELLNGRLLEVFCKTDACVSHIFQTVVNHLNITEHIFFGLAVHKENEYIFLDEEQKLEIFAPQGWWKTVSYPAIKHSTNHTNAFRFKLRFRYYPKKREFIRTRTTAHHLYLQLRKDMLDGLLRFSLDKAIEMAALALRVECSFSPPRSKDGDIPSYFRLENYLPSKLYTSKTSSEITDSQHKAQRISDLHAQFSSQATGISPLEAEEQFIKLAQTEASYGAHYYRVYKIKPSKKNENFNRYSETHLLKIMPFGIGISREKLATQNTDSIYEWPMIRTLQFDRKRLLISTIENNMDYVFYTDHYSKSSYLVRFAATQHRFMMKMRHWQSTHDRNRLIGKKDIGIEGDEVKADVLKSDPLNSTISYSSNPSFVNDANRELEISNSYDHEHIRSYYGSKPISLFLILEKDVNQGLGLTLVDGHVNGVKGVYVKSVCPDGDGKRKGLQVGDCLICINGQSLFNRTRHDAVELVRNCDSEVHLEILRFPSITDVLSSSEHNSRKTSNTLDNPHLEANPSSTLNPLDVAKPLSSHIDLDEVSTKIKSTLTPTLSSKHYPDKAEIRKRQRAVSDFGAIGDTLPSLRSDNLLLFLENRENRTSDSDSENIESSQMIHGEFKPQVSNISTMYSFNFDDEDAAFAARKDSMEIGHSNFHCYDKTSTPNSSEPHKFKKRTTLDWTNELVGIEEQSNSPVEPPINDDDVRRIMINIRPLPGQSFGFQIASSKDPSFVYIKNVNTEPALSAGLAVNDIIISINGIPTIGASQNEVAQLLRTSCEQATIEIQRDLNQDTNEETVVVVKLDKRKAKTIGVILSKKMNMDGVYIRSIAPGSVAADEGSLRVGDRICKVDGQTVFNENPSSIAKILKDAPDVFEIKVSRRT